MSYTDKHIVAAYSNMFEGLSLINKKELMESLSKSMNNKNEKRKKDFYNAFGAFASEKSAEEIIAEIKKSRKFNRSEIKF